MSVSSAGVHFTHPSMSVKQRMKEKNRSPHTIPYYSISWNKKQPTILVLW